MGCQPHSYEPRCLQAGAGVAALQPMDSLELHSRSPLPHCPIGTSRLPSILPGHRVSHIWLSTTWEFLESALTSDFIDFMEGTLCPL